MKRRVLVGQALVHKPPVIVLDEPTAGVDVELRQSLWAFIRKLNRDGHTIILTTHYLEEAEALCARIAMLQGGQGRRARHRSRTCCRASPGSPCGSSRDARARRRGSVARAAPRRRRCSSSASSATPISSRCSPRCASEGIAIDELALSGDRSRAGLPADHGRATFASRRIGGGAHDADRGAGWLTLLYKELLRFWKVALPDDPRAGADRAPLPAHLLARAGVERVRVRRQGRATRRS
mgnify:CR=1 FL=1